MESNKISNEFKIKIAIAFLSLYLDTFLFHKIYTYLRISIERIDLDLIMIPIFFIVLFSYGLMLFDVKMAFDINLFNISLHPFVLKKIPKENLTPLQLRRINCIPPYGIGLLMGIFSPFCWGLYYAIRHKDWRIIVYPLWLLFTITFFVNIPFEYDRYLESYLYLNFPAGLIAYLVARKNILSIAIQENKNLIT